MYTALSIDKLLEDESKSDVKKSNDGGVGGIDEKEEEGDQWQDLTAEEMINSFQNYNMSDDDFSGDDDDISEIDETEMFQQSNETISPQNEDDEESKLRKAMLAEALGMNPDQLSAKKSAVPQEQNNENHLLPMKTPKPDRVFVLPLFAMLSAEQQKLVFQPPPPGHRLIVVATNVAETSITIPGVRYVVDCGRQKERIIDIKSGISKYQVSRASISYTDFALIE